ncbi:MAG: sensor histidine kinase [Acidobacteriota bacterium]
MPTPAASAAAAATWTRPFVALHHRLLPQRREIGWTPYLWLFYLSAFVYRWFWQPPGAAIVALGAATLALFLVLYFSAYWRSERSLLWHIAGIVALGVAWAPFNFGALTFFIFAAGFCGFVGPPRQGVKTLLAIIAAALLTALAAGLPLYWWILTPALCSIIGATNIYFSDLSRANRDVRRSREEVERLAAVAERERIARDLHDLLGHTLTLITIKAELARRLAERGDSRAADEIADVEEISRDALAQVREAVEGFRDIGLAGELARSSRAIEAAGLELETAGFGEGGDLALDPRSEATLALVLREAVTNVVRHARASRCSIRLRVERSAKSEPAVCLEIADDGRGADAPSPGGAGHGLEGMRHRLESLGGRLEIAASGGAGPGFTLRALLPLQARSEGPGEASLAPADGAPALGGSAA